ncbi:MAG: hypothetical protein ACFBRM_12605 [Pikeienuella sp.]
MDDVILPAGVFDNTDPIVAIDWALACSPTIRPRLRRLAALHG